MREFRSSSWRKVKCHAQMKQPKCQEFFGLQKFVNCVWEFEISAADLLDQPWREEQFTHTFEKWLYDLLAESQRRFSIFSRRSLNINGQ